MANIINPADGNIKPNAWAVASDNKNSLCGLVFKTERGKKESLAEVRFRNGSWGLARPIKIHPKTPPGDCLALAYNPEDVNERVLIFMEPNASGYLLYQRYDSTNKTWGEPQKFETPDDDNREPFRAHTDSKIAATFCPTSNLLLVYSVTQNGAIQELQGTLKDGRYVWQMAGTAEFKALITGHLAVIQQEATTHIVYQNTKGLLKIMSGTREGGDDDDDEPEHVNWRAKTLLRREGDIDEFSETTPLAIAARSNESLTVFYVNEQSNTEYIYALTIPKDGKPKDGKYISVKVGKKEPDSILGAASFTPSGNLQQDARLFSVSKLDGDDVLLERVEIGTVFESTEKYAGNVWIVSGGIINTGINTEKSG